MELSNEELDEILAQAGLRIAEPYHPKGRYRKDEYIFTQCTRCGVEAHYRLKYILHKNEIGKRVCRACYWGSWYSSSHDLYNSSIRKLLASGFSREELKRQGIIREDKDSSWSEARKLANDNGLELVDLIHGMRPGDDILVTRCPNCGKQEVMRPSDITWGCSCDGPKAQGGVAYDASRDNMVRGEAPHTDEIYQTGGARVLSASSSDCLRWWDYEKNCGLTPEDATQRSRKLAWWKCPDCGSSFRAPVYQMSKSPHCPACLKEAALRYGIEWEWLKQRTVADLPELLAHWKDERDPFSVPVTYPRGCIFECPEGHHPNQTPYSYLTSGCMVCRGQQTKSAPDQVYLREANPELAAEWLEAVSSDRHTPDNVKPGSKRLVRWRCLACGGVWEATVRDREKRSNSRCPHCGKVMGSLAWNYPSLASEWSPDNPVSPWNTKPFGKLDFTPKWVCSRNPTHTWTAGTAVRINKGRGCPFCEKRGRA